MHIHIKWRTVNALANLGCMLLTFGITFALMLLDTNLLLYFAALLFGTLLGALVQPRMRLLDLKAKRETKQEERTKQLADEKKRDDELERINSLFHDTFDAR